MPRFFRMIALLLMLAGLAACGGATTSSSENHSASLTFTDATHTTVTLPKPPARFACLVGICEDILASLGIDPVAVNDTLGQNAAFFGARAKSFQIIGGPLVASSFSA